VAERFAGKVACVSGAGNGIGRAVCRRLAAEGAVVVGLDVDEACLHTLEQEIVEAGGRCQPIVVDISSRAACFDAVARCVETNGRLDVLGNVAGIVGTGHFTEIDEDAYRRLVAVNLDGTFFLAQAAMPHLLASNWNLVNIASNSALQGVAYLSAYSATKGAVVALTKSLALEYVKSGVRINAIAPAGTITALTRGFTLPADVDGELAVRPRGHRGANQPEEVAALFAFVASDEASGIHGAVLTIDRGLTA
jgi:NAD(P)-dependent dehydrogenase (short-subunit alcohol dehydrogenase family)